MVCNIYFSMYRTVCNIIIVLQLSRLIYRIHSENGKFLNFVFLSYLVSKLSFPFPLSCWSCQLFFEYLTYSLISIKRSGLVNVSCVTNDAWRVAPIARLVSAVLTFEKEKKNCLNLSVDSNRWQLSCFLSFSWIPLGQV